VADFIRLAFEAFDGIGCGAVATILHRWPFCRAAPRIRSHAATPSKFAVSRHLDSDLAQSFLQALNVTSALNFHVFGYGGGTANTNSRIRSGHKRVTSRSAPCRSLASAGLARIRPSVIMAGNRFNAMADKRLLQRPNFPASRLCPMDQPRQAAFPLQPQQGSIEHGRELSVIHLCRQLPSRQCLSTWQMALLGNDQDWPPTP
jgi:hypothetical protein